jgi:hypothetical protein
MVWIGGPATAHKTGLFDHMPDMIAVTNSTRFGEDKHTLVYLSCRACLYASACGLSRSSTRRVVGALAAMEPRPLGFIDENRGERRGVAALEL